MRDRKERKAQSISSFSSFSGFSSPLVRLMVSDLSSQQDLGGMSQFHNICLPEAAPIALHGY